MIRENRVLRVIFKYGMIALGCAIYAFGFQFFCYPNAITTGGVVGVAMILNQLTGLPVGVLTILMNIPLFIIAWRHFGLDFLIGSLAGMGLSSVMVDLFAVFGFAATDDTLLAALIGGVIKGIGMGMVYYVGATTGGMDIVIKLLRRRISFINFGTLMLLIDAVIITAYALILGRYESAMYSLVAMYTTTKMIDLALYGIDNACLCYIISDQSKVLTQEIVSGRLRRGVTILEGRGAFSGEKREVLMCAVKRPQLGELKRVVRSIDEHAFLIVTNANNVFGNGFENIAEVR